jgi:TRAP-type C4-dicarboxylate transport system substrate-binding protein
MKSMIWKTAFAAALAVAFTQTAVAADKLIFAAQSPAGSPNIAFYGEWVDRVNKAGNGVIDMELRVGETIANFGNSYDRVQNDVIQIGWMIPSILGGKYPLSDLISLPFLVNDDVACATAYWKLYESGMLDGEYHDIQPIDTECGSMTYTHFAKPLQRTDDLGGAKVRVRSKVEGHIMQLLGATPLTLASTEMYEGLRRGTIDAVNTSYAGFPIYKLNEVTTYHLEVPLGSAPMMHFMAKKKFDGLSKEARDLILAEGGLKRSREMGAYMDSLSKKYREEGVKAGHTYVQLTPEQTAQWKAKIQPAVTAWEAERPKGKDAIAIFKKAYDDALAGKY